jgi:omega-amidase
MSRETLRVTLVQTDLVWHDAAANRSAFERLLTPLAGKTDLVVLPEMFTTGFTMAPESEAEPANGPSVEWLRTMAARLGAVITGSITTSATCFAWPTRTSTTRPAPRS